MKGSAGMLPMGCPSEKTILRQLFDQQVERLISLGYHSAMGRTEGGFRQLVGPLRNGLDQIKGVDPTQIPFLVVFPHKFFSVAEQVYLLVIRKRRGAISVDTERLGNDQDLDSLVLPYLVCAVEDGTSTLGFSAEEADKRNKKEQRRYGLTCEEGVALATHFPEVIERQALFLTDTDYRGYFPELWLSSGGPVLGYDWPQSKKAERGVPSCSLRLIQNG